MVAHDLAKVETRVRFPYPAPHNLSLTPTIEYFRYNNRHTKTNNNLLFLAWLFRATSILLKTYAKHKVGQKSTPLLYKEKRI